jgi:hypothetical protein
MKGSTGNAEIGGPVLLLLPEGLPVEKIFPAERRVAN